MFVDAVRGRLLATCALMALSVVSLTLDGLDPTSFGGWPVSGLTVGVLLVSAQLGGPWVRGAVVIAQTVLVAACLGHSYDLTWPVAAAGGAAVTGPALLTAHLLRRARPCGAGLRGVDHSRFVGAVLAGGTATGVGAYAAAASVLPVPDAVLTGVMSALSSISSMFVVLPLLDGRRAEPMPSARAERVLERVLMVVSALFLLGFQSSGSLLFVLFPLLGWAAVRLKRSEAMGQMAAVCALAYVLTFCGVGPFSVTSAGIPERLTPALVYFFIIGAAYLVHPVSRVVEDLQRAIRGTRRAEETIENLADAAAGTFIVRSDRHGRVLRINSGVRSMTGRRTGEVVGEALDALLSPGEREEHAAALGVADDWASLLRAQATSGRVSDWRVTTRDGTDLLVSLGVSPVLGEAGAVEGYHVLGVDVTDREATQQRLRQMLAREHEVAQRYREADGLKDELVATVSHELRTPLTNIAGYAELLSAGDLGAVPDRQRAALAKITANVERLEGMVGGLLTLARAQSGELTLDTRPCDLRDVVGRATARVAPSPTRPGLVVEAPPSPVMVLGDRYSLEQVVDNLLGNALKFTTAEGSVTVTTRVACRAAADGARSRWAEVVVTDSGIGIAEAECARVFERFYRVGTSYTRAVPGSGLGLSIVRSLVDAHGGQVDLTSEPGIGTVVSVRLPLLDVG